MSGPNSFSILSVEDNPETRVLLEHLLQDSYAVTVVADADAALRVFEAQDFDLLLIDINLGAGMSGTELLQLIREREMGKGPPAVAVTAYAMPGDRKNLLKKGFDGYVAKPFTRNNLREAVRQTLEPV
jgi:CheY-like chemotaxis protein